jgi:hypothetical protein
MLGENSYKNNLTLPYLMLEYSHNMTTANINTTKILTKINAIRSQLDQLEALLNSPTKPKSIGDLVMDTLLTNNRPMFSMEITDFIRETLNPKKNYNDVISALGQLQKKGVVRWKWDIGPGNCRIKYYRLV